MIHGVPVPYRVLDGLLRVVRQSPRLAETRHARKQAEHLAGELAISRRSFLRGLSGIAICTACGVALCPDPIFAQVQEELHAPLYLDGIGEVHENKHYRIAADFQGDGNGSAIVIDAEGVRLRNITLDTGFTTWQTPAWDTSPPFPPPPPPGVAGNLTGILIRTAPRCQLKYVTVDGFPREAIRQFAVQQELPDAISESLFQDLFLSHCRVMMSINAQGSNPPESTCVRIERAHGLDAWSAPSDNGGLGGGMFAFTNLRDFIISDSTALGIQGGGFKLGSCKQSVVDGCQAMNITPASTSAVDGYADDVTIQNCIIDKTLAYTNQRQFNAVYVQGGAPANSRRIRILNNIIRCASLDPLHDGGHAIQLDDEVHVDARGNTIEGWNGLRGFENARALYCTGTLSSWNADFADPGVNTFINQNLKEFGVNTPAGPHPYTDPPKTTCRPGLAT